MKLKQSDKLIYLAILKLIKRGENVKVDSIAKEAGVTRGLIYYRLSNLHLLERSINGK